MRKTLSVMFSSHLLLLSVLLSPLWGVADVNVSSTTATTKMTKVENSTGGETTTAMLTSTMTTEKPPPKNVEKVTVVGQNETSITLMWTKVDNISTYTLKYYNNGNMTTENINASLPKPSVHYQVTSLTAGTKYSFTLVTVFEEEESSGFLFLAVTDPRNVEKVKVERQNETSITLMWTKVDNISTYTLKYYNNGNMTTENINASLPKPSVHYQVTSLTAGTKYSFTLVTVFEEEESSGFLFLAVTDPRNVEEVKVERQNETSITLMWTKVDNISTYTLKYYNNGNMTTENINASLPKPSVHYQVTSLTAGTKYSFTLVTVFEEEESSGFLFLAVTDPRNVEEVKVERQNETSITLMWTKVDNISTYTLKYYNNGNMTTENINASLPKPSVHYQVTSLTAGTKYSFTLVTVFEEEESSGFLFLAVTDPRNVEKVKVERQNETSITLMWTKVDNISTYTLKYYNNGNMTTENINASLPKPSVHYQVTSLTAGTKYSFTLVTVFEEEESSGFLFLAVTDPRNVEKVKVERQNETSITLMWTKVDNISTYTLKYYNNGNMTTENINASLPKPSVHYQVTSLTAGTKYSFTLVTVFEEEESSGFLFLAVTDPRNVEEVKVERQNETSITLMWTKVDNISTYTLKYYNNGNMTTKNINASLPKPSVHYQVTSLTAGTKYSFTLVTVFEEEESSGFLFLAVTVPSRVTFVQVTERSPTHLTLAWEVDVNKDWSYFLQINDEHLQLQTDKSRTMMSHPVTSLQPGTKYSFSLVTSFSQLNSTAYEDFTVTAINCDDGMWHVTNSSIRGEIEGLFTNATATNKSRVHQSAGGGNVSFTDLYPGATYEVSLEYEDGSRRFRQCNLSLTLIPPDLSASCRYRAGGHAVVILWDKPEGVWKEVEVNVTGRTYRTAGDEKQNIQISGLQPARAYQVSVATLVGSVRSSDPFIFSCSTDPRGVIAGSVFAVLLLVALVCVVVYIVLKRPDFFSKKMSFIFGSKQSKRKLKPVPVAKFPDHFYHLSADENRGFSEEYEDLKPVGTEQSQKEALFPHNKAKNRFSNVLPYDWCRVKLISADPSTTSDYINASYMPGYDSSREYIATQGPLPTTVNDFWRMIWEQRVRGIVMVTNCSEGGRTKCERYWPTEKESYLYGNLLVTVRTEQQEPNWTLRNFTVQHSKTSGEFKVKHFHFTAWPDHGVPQSTEVLIQFRELVREHIQRLRTPAPTVVHCSAGVGRTGTIIALDVLLQQLQKDQVVGVNGFVQKMRLSRPHMVQTESQYVFLHQCLMDRLQSDTKAEENIYENSDMIYANATALRDFSQA